MKIIYSAPNRAHHYIYAKGLFDKGVLYKFISGFSRLSKRSKIDIPGFPMVKADWLQTIYLVSLRFSLEYKVHARLAYWAKLEQDWVCSKNLKGADAVVVYNGSGLKSIIKAKKMGIATIVEAVNSHVSFQEELLRQEHIKLGLDWSPFYAPEVKRRLEEYAKADYILTPSEFVRASFLEKGFSTDKILKVPFGFKKMEALKHIQSKEKFKVLYVGSISVRKGLRYLIKAFQRLEVPNKQLILVGPKATLTGIEDLELTNDIIFTGVLKGDELSRAYSEADVFCLPTIEEGLALVIGEALSFGLPIITTENSGALDIIKEGKEGFIVPIRSVDAFEEKLNILASNYELRKTMSSNATKLAASLDGWDESIIRLKATLEGLL